jgi:hypothetical protein
MATITSAGFVAHVNGNVNNNANGVTTLATTVVSTALNDVVIVNIIFTSATPNAVTVTDNASTPNTYAQATTIGTTSTGSNAIMYQFYGVQTTAAATSVTVNWTTSANILVRIDEFSGGQTTNTSIFDTSKTVVQGSASTSLAMASYSPSEAHELVVACYSFATATTQIAGTGYTLPGGGSAASSAVERRLANNATETSPMTLGASRTYTGLAGVYKLATPVGFTTYATYNSTSSAATVTLPGIPAANNLLVMAITHNSSTAITDPSGWTKTVAGTSYNSSSDWGGVWYKLAAGTESSITTGATGTLAIGVVEISGNANPIVTDGTAATNATTAVTSKSTPSITTVNANDVILPIFMKITSSAGSFTTSTPLVNAAPGGGQYVAIGAYTPNATQIAFTDTLTWTSSTSVIAFIQAFKAPAPTTGTPSNMGLLGIG